MEIIDLIGFLIIVLAFLAPLLRRFLAKPKEQASPQREEVYYEVDIEPIEDVVEEIPPPQNEERFTAGPFDSSIERRHLEAGFGAQALSSQLESLTSVASARYGAEDVAYSVSDEGPSELQRRLAKRGAAQEMILFHTLLSPPVSE